MLENPQIYFFLLMYASAVFWVVPPHLYRIRAWVLILFSMLFLSSIAPYAVVYIMVVTLLLVGISRIIKFLPKNLFVLFSLIALLVIPLSLVRFYNGFGLGVLLTLGLTFSLLRAIVLVFLIHKKRKPLKITDSLLYMLFFPTYSIGPIEKQSTLTLKTLKNNAHFIPRQFISGLFRLILGFFKVMYLSDLIAPWIKVMEKGVFSTSYEHGVFYILCFSLLKLLVVYINFSGFSDIAIGAGRMFGIRIMENFNSPFLAKNIIDFWQRWHMSLGLWIKNYLYMPLIRNYGRIYSSIFAAFVIIGLWHDYTVNYFVWGIGHGVALALTQLYKRKQTSFNFFRFKIWRFLSDNVARVLTIIYVSILSTFANADGWENGVIYIKNIF